MHKPKQKQFEEMYTKAVNDLAEREEVVVQLQQEIAGTQKEVSEANEERRQLREEVKRVREQAELELHRALAAERAKWEAREERMAQQLRELQRGQSPPQPPVVPIVSPRQSVIEKEKTFVEESQTATATAPQTIPPLAKFSGDGDSGETFQEWQEQFELIAELGRWNERTRLVNLITRLRGQAYAFYRSCSPTQRGNYGMLMRELERRFTPVTIQAVQTNLFHERKQGAKESVDAYAQDLRQLFLRAYPATQRGSKEAEEIGESVLSSQFITGLRADLKAKLVGVEGDLDTLLVKARFEEAKQKSFGGNVATASPVGANTGRTTPRKPLGTQDGGKPSNREPPGNSPHRSMGPIRCYGCGGAGHMARNCPLKGRGGPTEAKGHKVATVVLEKETEGPSTKDWSSQVVDEEVHQVMVTLHGVNLERESGKVPLGKIPTTDITVEGETVEALVDTGSPVSIVSMRWLLRALARRRDGQTTPEDWAQTVKGRMKPTSVMLKSYSGDKLPIVRQIQLQVEKKKHRVQAWVQIQQDAPVDFLLGTDLQPLLGFFLGEKEDKIGPTVTDDPAVHPQSAVQGEEKDTLQQGQVCLLQAVRIPANFLRLVPVEKIGPGSEEEALFEPSEELVEKGLVLEDSLLGTQPQGMMVVRNPGVQPVVLDRGEVLGSIEPVAAIDELRSTGSEEMGEPGLCCQVQATECRTERQEQLLQCLPMDNWTLHEEGRRKVISLVLEFGDLFALDELELGCADGVCHEINTGDHKPIKQCPRRVPFALRGQVEDMIKRMLGQGVIQPSNSPWASPIVLVAKKDGSTRFCVDYRRLNSVTKMDVYPLPRIDDMLDQLCNNRFFTTLDLATGYWQVKVEASSQEKTAFTTHAGLYEFMVMPFGLCNAPATFQRLMEQVLHGLVGKSCLVYLDDVLVLGRDLEEHLANTRTVWTRLYQAGLRLKPSKCQLAKEEVEYLGFRVSGTGITTSPTKVQAVREFPIPKNVKSLRSFLGLASYYRRFIPNFSVIANPLFALTRKEAIYQWDQNCQEAFQQLKDILTEASVLAFPDFSREFLLETDASGLGLGAVLSQVQTNGECHPIAYASRTLQKHEKNYGITELEGLAVVWACKHFRQYLYGHHCQVITDHEALKALLNTPHPSGKLARWGLTLQELDLTIHYRPGRKNEKADALSRNPVGHGVEDHSDDARVVAAVSELPTPPQDVEDTPQTLGERQRQDPELASFIRYHEDGILPDDGPRARQLVATKPQYCVIEGILYHVAADGSLRIVPPEADRSTLFDGVHAGKYGAHLGDAKVFSTLGRHYWWPKMRSDVASWCKSCLVCATRRVGRAPKPPLTPIPVGGPFDRIGVDVLQLPTSSRGNQYAVVFIDYLTKWPEVFATKDQTAFTIGKLLVENIVSRHGVPSEILSDRGAAFLSGLFQEIYRLMGIHKVNTTAYHPQTDGLVERFNRTLLEMLSKTASKNGKDWDTRLPYVLFAYRVSMQPSTGESPFYLLYGRDARLPTDEVLAAPLDRYLIDANDYRRELTEKMQEAWESAQVCIKKAQARQKQQYDKRTRPETFSVGDRVFIHMPATRTGPAYKLARPFHGPYRVTTVHPNGVEVQPVDRPKEAPIRVALNRVRRCPHQMGNEFYPRAQGNERCRHREAMSFARDQPTDDAIEKATGQGEPDTDHWAGRLRSRNGRGCPTAGAGEM